VVYFSRRYPVESRSPVGVASQGGAAQVKNETKEAAAVHIAPHAHTGSELKAIIEAERIGMPFLLWRDQGGTQCIFSLGARVRATIGRRASNEIVLSDDDEASRTHAQFERVGEDWTVTDDGLSRNGTFLNGTRITQRRRLADGDIMRFGHTLVEFRNPGEGSTSMTRPDSIQPYVESVTETQRRILIALCRPYKDGGAYATPASNSEIASEVFLGVDAVKNHLRLLFQRFGIAGLPQNQKRARLVECAFQWGLVSERDL
jgi:hypothetical protein